MPRLMDLGLEKLTNLVLDMAKLSEKSVITALLSYMEGRDLKTEIFKWSEELRVLQDECSELAVELIARYQPVASDLRFVKSSMEIAYGFSRFGRYAFDIAEVLRMFPDLSDCDRSTVQKMGENVKEMISTSIQAFTTRDVELAKTLPAKDDEVDAIYTGHVKKTIEGSGGNLKCSISATLILRYLERIADHACYIGESVVYIVTGERAPRK